MLQIIRRLQQETGAKIALASLPMLGEDLNAPICRRVREYNACLQELALQEQVAYLPVYERLEVELNKVQPQPGRPFPGGSLAFKALAQHFLLRWSLDEISRRNGFRLLTDGIHLNSRGAALVAEEIETFLRGVE